MKDRKSKLKQTINFVDMNGVGTVRCHSGFRDIMVYGYFHRYHWDFIVHQDVEFPDCYIVSEASTGMCMTDPCFAVMEDALSAALSVIDEKRYYFFTRTKDVLVDGKYNLNNRNTNPLTLGVMQLCMN